MQLDVVDLRDFYGTPLGLTVRRAVGQQIRSRWRGFRGGVIIGLGYAAPYLGAFRNDAARIGALMPETQGALVWPAAGPLLSVLVEDDQLPLPDNSVDRLLLVHCLEVSQRPEHLLRELWRVLSPEGRLMIVVPNRRGVWARVDATPFGTGRPYSRSQLERLLTESLFTPLSWGAALHMPPVQRKIVLRSAPALERIGSKIWPRLAGLVIVEARKEVLATVGGKRVGVRVLKDLVGIRPVRAFENRKGAPLSRASGGAAETRPSRRAGSAATGNS